MFIASMTCYTAVNLPTNQVVWKQQRCCQAVDWCQDVKNNRKHLTCIRSVDEPSEAACRSLDGCRLLSLFEKDRKCLDMNKWLSLALFRSVCLPAQTCVKSELLHWCSFSAISSFVWSHWTSSSSEVRISSSALHFEGASASTIPVVADPSSLSFVVLSIYDVLFQPILPPSGDNDPMWLTISSALKDFGPISCEHAKEFVIFVVGACSYHAWPFAPVLFSPCTLHHSFLARPWDGACSCHVLPSAVSPCIPVVWCSALSISMADIDSCHPMPCVESPRPVGACWALWRWPHANCASSAHKPCHQPLQLSTHHKWQFGTCAMRFGLLQGYAIQKCCLSSPCWQKTRKGAK